MKHYLRYISLFVLLLITSNRLCAQLIYECDFELQAEREQWVLNAGKDGQQAQLANLWYMGENGNYSKSGEWGLYISHDKDEFKYKSKIDNDMFVTAWRELTIQNKGTYTVFFDWRGVGKRKPNEGLYVFWIPESASVQPYSESSYFAPTFIPATGSTQGLQEKVEFGQGQFNFTTSANNEQGKLVVLFRCLRDEEDSISSGFSVDNICISGTGCSTLSNLDYSISSTNSDLTVTWQGNGSSYDLQLRQPEFDVWIDANSTANQYVFTDLEEGRVLLRVRSRCRNGSVSPYEETAFYYYHKADLCIDYMELNKQTCSWAPYYYEDWAWSYYKLHKPLPVIAPEIQYGPRDFGSDDYVNTMHTLHMKDGEYDQYTEGKLLTKPAGAKASVRIGKFEGTHVSRVTYTYKVPEEEHSLLMLHYALVLPSPHDKDGDTLHNPVFTMEVLADGWPIPHNCGEANFVAGDNTRTDDWHPVNDGELYWKDWTDLGINLSDYQGMTITVRFTATGCAYTAHGGYAYITLECENGTIERQFCNSGDDHTKFKAPDGFYYRWYKANARRDRDGVVLQDEVISEEQEFSIEALDFETYNVDMISKTNRDCYYTLEVSGVPREPRAKIEAKHEAVDCRNIVHLKNLSGIVSVDPTTGRETITEDKMRYFTWNFGDGNSLISDDEDIEHEYPIEGGDFLITLGGTIPGTDSLCTDTTTYLLSIPSLIVPDEEVHISEGDRYRSVSYLDPNTDTDHDRGPVTLTDITEYGCEALTKVYVHKKNFQYKDTLCEGGYYQIADNRFENSGIYTVNLRNRYNLDSIITLNLTIDPTLQLQIDSVVTRCADDKLFILPYTVLKGRMDTLVLRSGTDAQAAGFQAEYGFAPYSEIEIPMPDSARPGYYSFTLSAGTERCPAPDYAVLVQNSYPADIVAQKDGLLGVLNEDYNGGYVFTNFLWYKNGEPLTDADRSYLQVYESDLDNEFSVMLTDTTGVAVPSCPIVYGNVSTAVSTIRKEQIYPTFLPSGNMINVPKGAQYEVLTPTGNIVSRGTAQLGQLKAPAVSGVYIIRLNNNNQTARIIVY